MSKKHKASKRASWIAPDYGLSWATSRLHECPPWHTPEDHNRTLIQAIRDWVKRR